MTQISSFWVGDRHRGYEDNIDMKLESLCRLSELYSIGMELCDIIISELYEDDNINNLEGSVETKTSQQI